MVAEDGPGSRMNLAFVAPDQVGVGIATPARTSRMRLSSGLSGVSFGRVTYSYRRWHQEFAARMCWTVLT